MAVKFDIDQNQITGTGSYVHIVKVEISKVEGDSRIGESDKWTLFFNAVLHKNSLIRQADTEDWNNRMLWPTVQSGSVDLANLTSVTAADTNPFTLAYGQLKTQLNGLATNIADA